VRDWLAALLYPKMCGEKISLLMKYRGMDTYDPAVRGIVPGVEVATWSACGRKIGHDGAHRSWSRWYRWRTIAAGWLER
jgi:hypothetical protein